MASLDRWKLQAAAFNHRGHRLLLHDFRGQLLSEKPAGPYRFRTHAEDAVALFDHLGIEKAHLVGTSYGGEVPMRTAIDFPDRVQSLSIIDSVSELDEVVRLNVEQWQRLARGGDPTEFYWGLVPTCYGAGFLARQGDMIRKRAEEFARVSPDFLMGQVPLYETFLRDVTMTSELGQIRAPTLVVCGEDDVIKPVRFSRILARVIPGAEFAIIPDCGHVTIFENPGVLNSLLLGFILKHARVSSSLPIPTPIAQS